MGEVETTTTTNATSSTSAATTQSNNSPNPNPNNEDDYYNLRTKYKKLTLERSKFCFSQLLPVALLTTITAALGNSTILFFSMEFVR